MSPTPDTLQSPEALTGPVAQPQHPRCSGCGTHNHSPETRCPNAPEMLEYMDDSWGDFETYEEGW